MVAAGAPEHVLVNRDRLGSHYNAFAAPCGAELVRFLFMSTTRDRDGSHVHDGFISSHTAWLTFRSLETVDMARANR
jgi:hypothetical protein